MLSVDTNIIIRLLTADDPRQFRAAEELFAAGPVWVSKTVLLETEWVLRDNYRLEAAGIYGALFKLLALENTYVEDRPSVLAALSLAERGIDFADALHLSSRPEGAEFLTFDRKFVRRAKRAGVTGISDASTFLSR